MKEIIKHDADLGNDGGRFEAALGVEGEFLTAKITAKYPIAKLIEPATKAFDNVMDKLEKLIPGDWDKEPIAKVKAEFAEQLVKLLAEKQGAQPQVEGAPA